jgi:acetyltransferase-like isoleucine patch superfamily enzyme
MNKFISKIISGWKGYNYRIDSRIPASYLLIMILNRSSMLLRGVSSRVKHRGLFFLSWRAVISSARLFKIGRGVTIERGCYINALSTDGIILGDNVAVGVNTRIVCTGNLQHLGKGLVVGNNAGLGCNSFYGCAGGISIGSDTIIGDFVSFHAENHNFQDMNLPIRLQGVNHKGIKVGRNCWIGAKATILDGAHIGDGCVIAAGAVVKAGLYGANGVYGGVPAKLLKYRESEELSYV